jgi:DNA invertase Pin-like site-specific DNA recombinase
MLRDYVREHFPDAKVTEYADDGYSGTNFDRPGVQELLEEVKNGMINCIVVKDFSRFGRDYIELGSYLEQIFPFMGVRFISINDKYDSDSFSGNVADIDVNFKNLLYDLYSRDLSVKVKASLRSIREQGNFIGTEPPFGYVKDPNDRHKLIIAEDEAERS